MPTGSCGLVHDDQGTDAVLRHLQGSLPDGCVITDREHVLCRDVPHRGREQQVIAAPVKQALVLHLPVDLVDVLGEMGLQEILGERGVHLDQFPDLVPAEQVADRVLEGDDRGLLPVLADERHEAEGVPFAPRWSMIISSPLSVLTETLTPPFFMILNASLALSSCFRMTVSRG